MDLVVASKIANFFADYRERKYHKGQVLILPRDGGDKIFHLVDGQVKQYDINYRGDEVVLNIFHPPAFFPMALAINRSDNPYTFEAMTDVVVRTVPAEDAVAFIKANPDVLFDLLSRVYRGTEGLLGRIVQLMSGSAKSRLMYELLIEQRRFGIEQDDGSFVLNVNETELGARSGLTRETVNREMRKLKTEKIISIAKRKIKVLDIALLEKKLGQTI